MTTTESKMSQNGVLEIPCLGKPFKLGMLYDCRSDRLISDATLWNDDILSNALASRHSKKSQCQIYTNDNLEEKLEMVGAQTNVKMSFLSGLAVAPNYVNFFEDRASPKQTARVTLKYESIAAFEELDVNILGSLPYEDFDELKNATHFVSGVSYGSNAFFVFDGEVRRNERYADVSKDMESLISSFSNISINDAGLVEIPEVHKEEAKKLSCTVYGDNPISNSTLSFEEAVKCFDKLRNNYGTVFPIRVCLQPLSSLNIEAARYLHEVNVETMSQTMSIMENHSDINIRLNVLTRTTPFATFPSIQKKISKFKAMTSDYKKALQKNLSILLPKVRSGDTLEDELTKVLKEEAATPFCQALLSSWVDKAEKEVRLLSMYLDYFKGIQFAFEPEERDSVINSLEYDRVVCFSFMIQKVQDEQLEEMYTYLRNGQFQRKPLEQRDWYENQVIINDFKTQARRFSSFAKANVNNTTKCIVTNVTTECQDDKIAVIQVFQDSQPIEFESNAILPQTPSVSKCVDDVDLAFKPTGIPKPRISTNAHSKELVGNTSYTFPNSSGDQRITQQEPRNKQKGRCYHLGKTWEGLTAEPESTHFLSKRLVNEDVDFETYAFDENGKKMTDINNKFVEAERSAKTSNAEGNLNRPNRRNTRHTKIQNQSTLAERMRLQSEVIKSAENEDSVFIYKIPTTETMRKQNEKLVKKCLKDPLQGRKPSFGGGPKEKVLMVMGATGAGKSTLINGMVNYIMGVEWEDKFRFKLIDESSSSQAHSVTKEITAYTIPPMEGSVLPYSFTIIDTPGYGDTEGLKRDMFITSQIKEFFSLGPPTGIDHLDGIGFVTQSSLARLTPTQTYIFDAILSIFGKDMGNNIFMMVTFADGQHPPVLTAVKKAKISYQNFFKFNNSALFAPNANCGFDQMFWQMGKASFEEFFCHFQSAKSVKLEQTNKVLDEREQLEVLVEGLNPQIKEGLAKLEEMRHERMALQEHESQMEHNKDFEFSVPTVKAKQTDLRGTGRHTTTCLYCNFTCHKDCKIADDSRKKECVAIDDDGQCTVCSGKCDWEQHKNQPYLIEYETVYEKRTSEDLKKKYDMGKLGKNKVEAMLKELENIYRDLRIQVVTNMYEVRLCLHRLDEIALKPNPLTELDYIELLIEAEKNERNEGWMDRLRAYEEVKSKAAMFAKIKSTKEIPKLVDEILPKQEESATSGNIVLKKGSQCVIQ